MKRLQFSANRHSQLTEMPELAGSFETFGVLEKAIDEVKQHVPNPQDLGNGLKKIEYDREVFYWYEKNQQIHLGVIMSMPPDHPKRLLVTLLGKNRQSREQRPYAEDLYMDILKDNPDKMIFSDVELSVGGFKFWEGMVKRGRNIFAYDELNKKFIKIRNVSHFRKFISSKFENYRYVLAQPQEKNESLNEIQRIAQLAGTSFKS